jgi:PEP-CTERM motif
MKTILTLAAVLALACFGFATKANADPIAPGWVTDRDSEVGSFDGGWFKSGSDHWRHWNYDPDKWSSDRWTWSGLGLEHDGYGDCGWSNDVGDVGSTGLPEPASVTLLGLGLLGVPFLRRKK